jgi:hypothetical protein
VDDTITGVRQDRYVERLRTHRNREIDELFFSFSTAASSKPRSTDLVRKLGLKKKGAAKPVYSVCQTAPTHTEYTGPGASTSRTAQYRPPPCGAV